MPRKIGFARTRDAQGPAPARSTGRVLVTAILLCIMGGIGGALAIDGLKDGNIIGFVVGFIWCVALVSVGAGKLIRHLLGIDTGREDRRAEHRWTHDDEPS